MKITIHVGNQRTWGKAPMSKRVKELIRDGYGGELMIKAINAQDEIFEVDGTKFTTRPPKTI